MGIRAVPLVFFVSCASVLCAQQPLLVLPTGHTGDVTTARFSPDGKYVITGANDKMAMVWETFSGKKIQSLGGHKTEISYAFFSGNGKYIATGTDSAVVIWSVPSYKVLGQFNLVDHVLFSPDSKRLFLVGLTGTIKQFALPGLTLEHEYRDSVRKTFHLPVEATAAISNDSKLLCSANDSIITLRDVQTGSTVLRRQISSNLRSCFFTPDNRSLVMLTDLDMQRMDLDNHFAISQLADYPASVSFLSNNNRFLLMAGDISEESAVLWDLDSYKPVIRLDTVRSVYDTMSAEKNGKSYFYTGSASLHFPSKHLMFQPSVEISNDGKYLRALDELWNNADLTRSYLITENHLGRSDISNDGKYILIQQYKGIVGLWDITAKKIVQTYRTKADDISVADISPDGTKFLALRDSGSIKINSVGTGKLLRVLKGHTAPVLYAAFSKDGTKVLSNGMDSTAILWDLASGAILKKYKHQDPTMNPAYFEWDGEIRLTTVEKDTVAIYDPDGNYKNGEVVVRIISNPAILADRKSYSGRYELIPRDFTELMLNDKQHANSAWFRFNSDTWDDAFSRDDKWLAFADVYDTDTLRIWDIEKKLWSYQVSLGVTAKRYGEKGISRMVFSPDSKYLLATDINEIIHVLSVPDFKERYTLAGSNCHFSNDGKYLLAISEGGIDIYDFAAGKLLYHYISVDAANYLAVDPEKRYDGTEAARKLIYFTCGNEIIELEQFKALCWEPGLVSKIMGNTKEAITAATLSEINICNFTPEVEEKRVEGGIYRYEIRPRTGGIGQVQLYINGKLIKYWEPANLSVDNGVYQLTFTQKEIEDYLVSGLPNDITVKATTKEGTMSSRGLVITTQSGKKTNADPNMYIVSIGISKYKGELLKLGYASKDAVDFAAALSSAAKKLLNNDGKEHVSTYAFNTENDSQRWPAKLSIINTLDSISQHATADDILVIFFAGHGTLKPGEKNLYLLTAEAVSFDQVQSVPGQVTISTDELIEWMRKIKANKQLLILDACNSGQVVQNLQEMMKKRDVPADQQRALENLKDQTGTFILSASSAGQSAYETSLYGQGLLTYSLLSGIKLGDGLTDNKYIDVTKWFNTASNTVKIMAKDIGGRQDPQLIGTASFDVGLVDKEVADGIKLSIKKKIFRRSNIIKDGPIPTDNLGLSVLVDNELNEISLRGKASPLAYIADNTLLDAYSVVGRYSVNGNLVKVKVYLMKGQEDVKVEHQFDLSGTVDKKEELALKLAEMIKSFILK